MFGMPRRAGMFGNRQMMDGMAPQMRPFAQSDPMQGIPQPDYMGGQGGVQPQPQMPQMPAPQQQQPRDPYAPATGSRRVVGILGDFLSGMAGGPANFAQSQNQLGQERRQFQQRQQLAELQQETERQTYAARQAAEQAQWVARQEYERANPAPQQPNDFERAMAAAGILPGSERYIELAGQRAQGLANPMQYLPTGVPGQYLPVPRSGLTQPPAPSTPDAPQPGAVVRDPRQGGQTGAPSGGFR